MMTIDCWTRLTRDVREASGAVSDAAAPMRRRSAAPVRPIARRAIWSFLVGLILWGLAATAPAFAACDTSLDFTGAALNDTRTLDVSTCSEQIRAGLYIANGFDSQTDGPLQYSTGIGNASSATVTATNGAKYLVTPVTVDGGLTYSSYTFQITQFATSATGSYTLYYASTSCPVTQTCTLATNPPFLYYGTTDTAYAIGFTNVPLSASAPTISAAFSPTTISAHGGATPHDSTLTLTITNPNSGTALSGVAVSATLPANLAGDSPSSTCSSATTGYNSGSQVLSLSGASLAASASCTVTLTVSSTTANTYGLTTGAVSSTTPALTGTTATTNTLTIVAAPTATQAIASKSLTQNHAATSFTPVTGGSGQAPLVYTVAPALPTGLSMASATGAITGTPTATATATTHTVTVTDAFGATATATFQLTVNGAVSASQAVASTALTQNTAATSFTPVTGSGGTAPLAYSVSPALPTGLTMASASGAITGTPTATSSATTYTVTVTDANSATATATFSLTVNGAPSATQAIASKTLTQNTAATSFTPVTGGGGTGSLSYSVSPALPTGLSMASATGAITGTPTATSAATTYTVTVTDANSATASNTFSLTVAAPPTATQEIASTALTRNVAATSFTPVTGSGGAAPLSYSVSPTLPTGLSMASSTGAVTGTPTVTSAATTYTVTVTDANGGTGTATFSLTVNAAPTATQAVASTVLTQNTAATSFTPVTGSGGTAPLAYSVSPALPTGLSMASSTGAVTGTPTATSAATTHTVTVTDANGGTATATFSLTVNAAPTATQAIASTSLTRNTAASSFTPVTGSGGTTPLSYSVSPALPTGLSMASSTGAVTGTPTATSGATTYTVTVTDANGATASATFSLTVNAAPSATQAVASTVLTRNTAATSFTPVTGSGGTTPLAYSVSPALPTGLSMASASGAITGTPTVASAATTYTVTVTDANGATATATFSLTVNGAVTATQAIASKALTQNTAATSFTPVTGSGGTSPLAYSVSPALPTGLSMASSTGAVTGTPTATSAATTYTVTVTDANSATATATFSLTVNAAVTATQAVATKVLTRNTAATSFTPVTGSGGTSPLAYSVSPALPTGLTMASSTGAVTGTPTATAAATTHTVTVTDANGATATATFSLTVNAAVTATQAIASKSLAVNTAVTSFTPVTGSGGTSPLAYGVSPALPTGLSMASSTGAITGTPTATSAATTYTVTVTDANSATATASFSLTVNSAVTATQAIASKVLTRNAAAASFTPVTGAGGTSPLAYSVSPALPTGLTMASSSGAVTGTPTVASAAATYTVTVTDANNVTATATFSLTVNTAVAATQAVASKVLTQNTAASSFTPVTGSGGTAPLAYSVSPALPTGLTMASSTGAVTGTPTASAAATTHTVTVTDANGATATATFSLTVNGTVTATQAIASKVLTRNAAATSFTPVTGSGGTAPLAYGVSPALPTGLTMASSTGAITGTPTAASAAATYTVTVTDANGASATATFSLTVNGAVTATQAIASKVLTRNTAATSFTPVTGSGGTTPLAYSVSPALPTGLTMASASGAITGTPTVSAAATTHTVTVTDANGATATATFSLTVNGAVTATQAIASKVLTRNTAATSFTPVTGSGGTTPLAYSVSPALPTGLAMASASGAITGTPTAASAAATYTVTVTDANGASATATFSLTVNGSVVATQAIASKVLTRNTAATSFTPVTGSGGTTPLAYGVSPALPTGLAMASSTGAITGTPTVASAAATYTVTVTDANGASATATFSLTVNGSVVATQAIASKVLTRNTAATSFTPVTGSGGTTPLAYSVSPALPTGLAMASSTGAITGTPTVASSATTHTVTVTDANGASATATFSLTVNGAVTATQAIASKVLTRNTAATSFTPVTGSGGTTPLTYTVSPALPTGLSMASSTGAVTGTPTATTAATTHTVTVTDANGASATATFSLTVNGAVVATQAIASKVLTRNRAVTPFTPVTGSGGTTPLTYSVSPALPAGLAMASATGTITGTPTVSTGANTGMRAASAAATTHTVTVTDANGASATATFSLTVNGAVVATQAIASKVLTRNTAATAFTPVTGSGGTAPLTYSVSPALPTGLTMASASGAITGTPTVTSAAATYTVTVTDANGATATASFGLTVDAEITIGVVVRTKVVVVGQSVTAFAPLDVTGGVRPFTFSVTPALPAGLGLDAATGRISGTPTAASAATAYTIRVVDANGATGSGTFTLTVTAVAVANDTATTLQGVAVAIDVTANDRGGPFTGVRVASAPAHGRATVSGLQILYTPDASFTGTERFTYTATTSGGVSAPATVTVTVSARPDPSKNSDVVGIISAQNMMAEQFARTQISNFNSRLESMHGTGRVGNRLGVSIQNGGPRFPDEMRDERDRGPADRLESPTGVVDGDKPTGPASRPSASGRARKADREPARGGEAPAATELFDRDFAFWASGAITVGRVDANSRVDTTKIETSGLSAGVDHRFSDLLSIGLGLGYGRATADIGTRGSRVDATSYSLVGYASLRPSTWSFVDLIVGYDKLDFDSQRSIDGTPALAIGSRSGQMLFGAVTTGVEYKRDNWMLSPYLRVDGLFGSLDGFTERAADPSKALHYDRQDLSSMSVNLGLRGKIATTWDFGKVTPFFRAEFQHDVARTANAGLSWADLGSGGPHYTLAIPHPSATRGLLGLGAEMDIWGFLIGLEYQNTFGSSSETQTVTAKVVKRF